MSVDERKISVSIGGDKVPVVYVAEVFQHIQNILYSLGDHLQGNEPRPKGDFPQFIKDYCSLVITGLDTGSVHAQMQIGDAQVSLPEMQTLGEKAIFVANDILKLLSEGQLINKDALNQQLNKIINNTHRLNRVLREYEAICPNQSRFEVSFKFGGSSPKALSFSHKEIIRSLLQKTAEEAEKEVDGRLIEIRVDKKRQFLIDSPEGQIACQYSPEIEDSIIGFIGKFVKIRGTMKPLGKVIRGSR